MIEIFGYVTPLKSELKIREYEIYRAFYCSVCKSIGKNFGELSRIGLINESASLAIILTLACNEAQTLFYKGERCIVHPIKKRLCAQRNDAIIYSAAVNVILEYHKLMDSYYDNNNVLSRSAALTIKRAYKKARKNAPILCSFVEIYMKDQLLLEKNNCNMLDEACEPTARMLSEIFTWKDSDLLDVDPCLRDALHTLGYNMGKWLYIIDAISDIEDDKKKNNYNVLLKNELYYYKEKITDNVIFTVNMCLAEVSNSWEIIKQCIKTEKYRDLFAIIDNLVYLGMRNVSEKVIGGEKNVQSI